jgi:hypothetical protein
VEHGGFGFSFIGALLVGSGGGDGHGICRMLMPLPASWALASTGYK